MSGTSEFIPCFYFIIKYNRVNYSKLLIPWKTIKGHITKYNYIVLFQSAILIAYKKINKQSDHIQIKRQIKKLEALVIRYRSPDINKPS
jgi:hypothetical protein